MIFMAVVRIYSFPIMKTKLHKAVAHMAGIGLWPDDGVLARTADGQPWAMAELDFAAFEASRAHAQVANDRDWSAQYFPTVLRARLERAADHGSRAALARA